MIITSAAPPHIETYAAKKKCPSASLRVGSGYCVEKEISEAIHNYNTSQHDNIEKLFDSNIVSARVRLLPGRSKKSIVAIVSSTITADTRNIHYAAMSTDAECMAPAFK